MKSLAWIPASLLLIVAAAPAVAAAPVADAADMEVSGGCDPDAGPFDPCLWMCNPLGTITLHCAVLGGVLIIGGAAWKCVFHGQC